MKFPSIFRSVSPMRFDIKPRYYDPISEEIEQRTSRIKRELTEEGVLGDDGDLESDKGYGGGIRGSFAQHRGIKPKGSKLFDSTAMIRTLLFFAMVIGAFGYIYIGPAILTYMIVGAVVVGGIFYSFRFLKRGNNDD